MSTASNVLGEISDCLIYWYKQYFEKDFELQLFDEERFRHTRDKPNKYFCKMI